MFGGGGRFNGGSFALPVWGAHTWRGLYSEFYGMVCHISKFCSQCLFLSTDLFCFCRELSWSNR